MHSRSIACNTDINATISFISLLVYTNVICFSFFKKNKIK